MRKSFLPDLFAGLLILLFMYTAINKFAHLRAFEDVLSKSPLLSIASWPVAVLIPAVEVMISGMLFFPQTQKSGFRLAFLLMTGFTIYIGAMLVFASRLPCSCGGVLSELTWKGHLFFNLFFVCISALGIRLSRQVSASTAHMSPQ